MSGSIWAPGSSPISTANADNSYVSQRFVASAGQTLFTLTDFVYQTGTGSLVISVNGLDKAISVDFVEVSNTKVALITPAVDGDIVLVHGVVGTTGAPAAAVSAAASQAALAAILALGLPSLPLTITNGGTGQATKTLGFNALSPVTTKGDLVVRDATNNIRFPVGLDRQSLTADSTKTAGMKWAYPSTPRVSRGSNVKLVAADSGKFIDITSGTFAQTLDPSASLTDGWFVFIGNSGTGFATITPDTTLSETVTVNQFALTSWVLWPNEFGILFCNGTALFYYQMQKGKIVTTVGAGVASIAFSSGLAHRKKLSLLVEGLVLSNTTPLKIYLNTSTAANRTGYISYGAAATGGASSTLSIPVAESTHASGSGSTRVFADLNVILGAISTMISGHSQTNDTADVATNNSVLAIWTGITELTLSDITIAPDAGTIGAGTVTLIEL